VSVSPTALSWLACALGAPGLTLSMGRTSGRWRGKLASPTDLAIGQPGEHPSEAPYEHDRRHRYARLQVLRRSLDLEPAGRFAIEERLGQALRSEPHPVLLRRLFLWIDGRRVDARLKHRFPGAVRDLRLDPAPPAPAPYRQWLGSQLEGDPAPNDAAQALAQALALHRALIAAHQAARPTRPRQPRPPLIIVQRQGLPAPAMNATMQSPLNEKTQPDREPRHDRGAAQGARKAPSPPQAGKRLRARNSADAGAGGELGPAEESIGQDGEEATGHPVVAGPRAGRARASRAHGTITRHDEWDAAHGSYLTAWTAVHERRLAGSDLHWLAQLRQRYEGLSRMIRRRFSHMESAGAHRVHRQSEGRWLDLQAAIDDQIDRRSGRAVSTDRLYEDLHPGSREVSVALLMDMSGSTGYPVVARSDLRKDASDASPEDDEPFWQIATGTRGSQAAPTRRVIDVARDAAGLLCEALDALGDRHAVYAFSGDGRQWVDFAIVKDFDDPWSAQTGAALAAVQPQGATRTGAAIRQALEHLRKETARRRLLIVLSDGYPQDRDYGPDPNDPRHGLLDTAQALREAERAGVSTFNISVDAGAHDYLRRICPRQRYWVVDEVDALPERMLRLCRLLAHGA
jgi:nitric oxide reductase NorD protein